MLIEYIILSLENNFLFEFFKNSLIILFIVIINFSFHVVLIRNDLDKLIYLTKKLRLRSIINLEINGYYYLNDFEKVYKFTFKLFK